MYEARKFVWYLAGGWYIRYEIVQLLLALANWFSDKAPACYQTDNFHYGAVLCIAFQPNYSHFVYS